MGIKKFVARAAGKAADKVAQLSALSPEQLREMEEFKEAYLTEMPDPTDEIAEEMTMRLLASAGIEIYNAYLPQIKQLYLPVNSNAEYDGGDFEAEHSIRYFKINRWVTDTKENSLEKLVNVYATLANEECNISLIFHRTMDQTDVYLAVTDTKNTGSNKTTQDLSDRLKSALFGNFPGVEIDAKTGKGVIPYLKTGKQYSIASASNIPTEKSEKFISQTIEKLIDGIVPNRPESEYTLILLATPVRDIEERKLRLAELYSGLAPYAGWQTNFTFTQSDAKNSMASFGVNAGISAGIQSGQNQSVSNSQGVTNSSNQSVTDSTGTSKTETKGSSVSNSNSESFSHGEGSSSSDTTSHSDSSNSSDSISAGVSYSNSATEGVEVGAGIPGANASVNASASQTFGVNANTSHTTGKTVTDGIANTVAKNISDTVTKTAGKTIAESVSNAVSSTTGRAVTNALGRAVTDTVAKTAGTYKGINYGGNFGANFARSSNVTATVGKNEGITQSYTNYTIKHTLEVLEEQMKRCEQSVALGMWDFAAYVLSEDINTVNNVAHSYLALTQGEKSYLSQASVNTWRGDVKEQKDAAYEVFKYLRELRHPVFCINPDIIKSDHTFSTYPTVVTATTSLSGKELAYSLNFPQKSIVGLPVMQCAEFGRNVTSYAADNSKDKLQLGNIFHMNHEENVPVELDKNSLTGHTFVTGSTGSGKSNTIYTILSKVRNTGTKFLVVEPAKGEYKTVFGSADDVSVYGTNPSKTPLLRINPFSFPEDIHVLEHLDRLVEIFNVCWPMYAAMPAVLKNAIEKSYEDCGWDMIQSINEYGNDLFPSFADVARNVRIIIDTSEYDTENKGAYKGSLLTRLQSLSNGINGLIFTNKEIEPSKLFDENIIIDLSRVGSSETKSLLMGMLVLKLQEYRMSETSVFNNELKHITVLEEAHNLLKRTSTDQPVEGGNLLGKSVEMLANAIAEMRTYGEGFIIADQAPGLLDLSVIRNTNTKIIMRLPDETDRMLVGKAANLNDDQIRELAKLPLGVGAVYQNDWIQPVLCKISHYNYVNSKYQYDFDNEPNDLSFDSYGQSIQIADLLSKGVKLEKEVVLKEIKPFLDQMHISATTQVTIMNMLQDPPKEPRMKKLAPVMGELFPDVLKAVKKAYQDSPEKCEWTNAATLALFKEDYIIENQTYRDIIQSVITYYLVHILNREDTLTEWRKTGGLA